MVHCDVQDVRPEIEIGVPDKDGRREVLQIHTRGMPLDENVDLDEIAEITHGFVGADLQSLCKESAMRVIRRVSLKLRVTRRFHRKL